MKTIALLAGVSAMVLTGCPSKESSSSSGATTPTATASSTSSAAPSAGSGPLANLDAQPSVAEAWTAADGRQLPMLYFQAQNVRISAQCKQPSGQLDCDAIRQLRNAPPIDVSGHGGHPGTSMGTRACKKLSHPLVTGHNSVGSEDGFCQFPDGSMVSTGALEQYAVHVLE